MARYNGTTHDDTLVGAQSEADTFTAFGIGIDRIWGGNFDDVFTLFADEKTDTIVGGYGEDRVDYSLSDRALTIDLSAGKVSAIFGSSFFGVGSSFFGGSFNEKLHVGVVAYLANIEDATGSNFNDTIIGTGHFSTIDGGFGDDVLDGGRGGINTVSFASHDLALLVPDEQDNIELGRNGADGDADVLGRPAGSGSFQLLESDTLRNFHNVIGSNHPEGIGGNEQDNTLNGRGGNDVINGFEGNDTLIGGDGNDRLVGSLGADALTGGKDSDTFIFVSITDSPDASGKFDVITDFEHGIDKIDLSAIDANILSGFQHFTITAAEIPQAGEVSIYYVSQLDITGVDANTTGSDHPDFHLQLYGHINLTASDFIL